MKRLSTVISLLISTLVFSQNINIENHWWMPNGDVRTIVKDEINNVVYLGGNFSSVGPPVPYGGQIDSTGNTDLNFAKPNQKVRVCVSDGNGGWYIGGDFTMVGDSSRNYIAHITSLGQVSAWNPNSNNFITAIVISGDTVYTAGYFSNIGGQTRQKIAAIDAITGIATSWNPNISGSEVCSIIVSGTKVYVGGIFSSIGGQIRNNIGAINTLTGIATSWNPNANTTVKSLAISGSKIFAAGYFSTIGGQNRIKLAEIDSSTGLATTWIPPTINSDIETMSVSGNSIYIGGDFSSIGGLTRNYIASIDATTGLTTSWNPNANGSVYFITASESKIYTGGLFSSIGGQNRNNIAALDSSTGMATTWNPNADNSVSAIGTSGSKIYAGGQFSSIGGQYRMNIAALDATTGQLTSWNPYAPCSCSGNSTAVSSIAVSGNIVYVGGSFFQIGGQSRPYLAAIDATTGLATSWNPNTSGGRVSSIIVSGTKVYVGGSFSYIGGQTRNGVATLDATSGLATSWNPNLNGSVYSMALSGNILYVGGLISSIGGQTRNYIGAIDAITGLVTSWNPNAGNVITSLAVSGTKVYAGGSFYNIGGQNRLGLAALDATTGIATSWNPSSGSEIHSIAISGTKVYVGGVFSSMGGKTRYNIAALDSSTGIATSWNPNADYYVFAIATSDTTTLIGGNFENIGGKPKTNFAVVLSNTKSIDSKTACNSYTWIDGNTYNTSTNSPTFILTNVAGCDSVITLNLTINNLMANYNSIDNGNGNFSFTNTSTGSFNKIHWAFGDGTTSTVVNPNHTFNANGTYVVVLTVNDSTIGSSCIDYYLDTIVVIGVPSPDQCLAGFVVYPDAGNVTVINSSTGNNLTYLWDFGDGNTSTLQTPSHTYSSTGVDESFLVCLTVDDGAGCVDMYCDSIGERGVVFNKQTNFTINVFAPPIVTGIDNQSDLNSMVRIYPNPTSTQLTIDTKLPIKEVVIIDIAGQIIKSIVPKANKIDVSNLSDGIYFIKVVGDEQTIIQKFVKD